MTTTVGAAMLIGVLGGSLLQITVANAATTNATASATPSQSGQQNQPPQGGDFDPSKGGHTANGITEQILTGDTAGKAKAAALAAVPGGTIVRVETDAEGATYEAHMTKSDGSKVTVKMDRNFKVTGIENGMGGPIGNQSQTVK
jgi:hypothetical protein